jgi:C4-dicarboxylate transporter DctM subunit
MEWWVLALLIVVPLIILLATGIPIAFALGIVSAGALLLAGGFPALSALRYIPLGVLFNFVLIPIPLFVIMAELLIISGISRDLFDAIYEWVGRIPGGVAISTILTGAVIGAMCGISAASVAILAVFCIDEFERFNYRRSLTSGCIASTGALAILIPPSVPMILYGALSEQSIGALFIAGLLPGLILAGFFSIYSAMDGFKNRHLYLRPQPRPIKQKLMHIQKIGPALVIVIVVLGAIYAGYATATESAALGCLAVFVFCLARRRLTVSKFLQALLRSVSINCMIFFILFCAMLFGHTMTWLRIPQTITEITISMKLPGWMIIASSQIMLFVLGCFLEIISIILITTPILLPIVVAYGFNPIWFGVLMMVNMEMALVTPPVGLNLWVLYSVADKRGFNLTKDIIPGILPFILLDALLIVLLMFYPQIALWLPSMVK